MHQNSGDHFDGGIAEDSKWQARWEKLVWMTAQRYGASSGNVRKRLFGILSVELDGDCTSKWSAERVVVFRSVILKRSQDIDYPAQFRKGILFLLD